MCVEFEKRKGRKGNKIGEVNSNCCSIEINIKTLKRFSEQKKVQINEEEMQNDVK